MIHMEMVEVNLLLTETFLQMLVLLALWIYVSIYLVVDLSPSGMPERLPLKAWWECFGVRVRRVEIAPFEQTAVAKIRIAAYDASGCADPVTQARSQDPEDPKMRIDRQHD